MLIKFIFILFFTIVSYGSIDFEEYQKNCEQNNKNIGKFVGWVNHNFQQGLINGKIHRSKKYCFDILEFLYGGKGVEFTNTRPANAEEMQILKPIIDTIFAILKNDDIESDFSGSEKLDNSTFLNARKALIANVDKNLLSHAVNSRTAFTIIDPNNVKYIDSYIDYSKFFDLNNKVIYEYFSNTFSTNKAMRIVYNAIFHQVLQIKYLEKYPQIPKEYNEAIEFFKEKDCHGHYKIFSNNSTYLDTQTSFDMIALAQPARMMYGYDFINQMLQRQKDYYLFPEFNSMWDFEDYNSVKEGAVTYYDKDKLKIETVVETILKMGYKGYTCSFGYSSHATTFVVDKTKKQILVIDPINGWHHKDTFDEIFEKIKQIKGCEDFDARYVPLGVQGGDKKCVMWSCIFLKVSSWFGADGYKKFIKALKSGKILKHSDITFDLLKDIEVNNNETYEKITYNQKFKEITKTLVYDLQEKFLEKFLEIVNADRYGEIKKILDDEDLNDPLKSVQIRGDDWIDQTEKRFYEQMMKNRKSRKGF